ncbi:hypothetical protein ACFX11_035434 [Malus domestica]
MWDVVGLSLVAFLVIRLAYWINQWRNPKCNGVLPPGSMGLPLIGETLHLLTPSYSLDLHPFLKKRFQRYGPIFRTSLVGKPVLVLAGPEFNKYVVQQEGRMVDQWYLDTLSKIFLQEGESRTNKIGVVHKYIRSIFLNHFGTECIKEKLLPQIEETINKHLCAWSSQKSDEVKNASSVVNFKPS